MSAAQGRTDRQERQTDGTEDCYGRIDKTDRYRTGQMTDDRGQTDRQTEDCS